MFDAKKLQSNAFLKLSRNALRNSVTEKEIDNRHRWWLLTFLYIMCIVLFCIIFYDYYSFFCMLHWLIFQYHLHHSLVIEMSGDGSSNMNLIAFQEWGLMKVIGIFLSLSHPPYISLTFNFCAKMSLLFSFYMHII